METVERRIAKAQSMAKGGDKKFIEEANLLTRIYKWLESGKPVRTMELSDDEKELVKSFFLLTDKPVIYCANVSEDQTGGNEYTKAVEEYAKAEGSEVVVISAKIEEELASLSDDERKAFLDDLGIEEGALPKLITACYKLLGLISYLTAGEKEVRAWTIGAERKRRKRQEKSIPTLKRGLSVRK